ncbi:MAG: thermonuclease family protein [Candidatus Wildermuthbacteria bacterium]|nr:thermonuclease family protein [Candidatus Wildermuthbacteria bacterium]
MKNLFHTQPVVFIVFIAFVSIAGIYLSGSSEENVRESEGVPSRIFITKIIDGDTVIGQGGRAIRLLGIDADEKGYPCYEAAKKRLEELVLNKEVGLEKDTEDKDQYQRYLRFLFVGSRNASTQLAEEGLVIVRFYSEQAKYRDEIVQAEKDAMERKIGCKWTRAESGI